jgi:hypothetical protein
MKKSIANVSTGRYIYRHMPITPFFPAWQARLNPMGSRSVRALRTVTALTLCQLEKCFAAWIPTHLFPKATDHQNSRDRCYTRRRPSWSLWSRGRPGTPSAL